MTRATMLLFVNAFNLVPAVSGGGATTPMVPSINDSVLEGQLLTAYKGLTGAPVASVQGVTGLES
jgi:hypothetical protein